MPSAARSAFSLTVSNATAHTTLSAYFDFNQDGIFSDNAERVAYRTSVVNGVNNLNFNVPASAKVGTTTARFRVSDNQNTFGSSLALSGETEDHLVTLERTSTLTLPTSGANDVVIRRAGNNVEVVNRLNSAVLFSDSLASLSRLVVVGADTQSDTVLVDYVTGGFFSLASGLEINGQGGADVLTINGSGNAPAVYGLASGNRPRLTLTQAAQSNAVVYTNFETQTFNGLQSFTTSSAFDVGANSITINAVDPVSLDNATSISGGTLTATALTLAANQTLSGSGTVAGRFSGANGSNVQLSGNLTIGNASATNGFETTGNVLTGGNVLTLLDADEARLGNQTTVGTSSIAGQIVAANGLLVSSGARLSGFGTIQSPTASNLALINHGTIEGNSAGNRLTINGFVTGTGTLHRVLVAGVASPGSNIINASYGDVSYAGALIMELGGTVAGTSYDQINHSGPVALAGALEVRLVNGFVPSLGTQFTLMATSSSITGVFTNFVLPAAPAGSQWEVGTTTTTVKLQLTALSVSIAGSSISENGGSTTATVSRNSYDLTQSLTVNLASSDTTEATVPASVTIPAGASTATFTISAVDDTLLDGPQTATITVSAAGLASDARSLTVTDFETLSLSIASGSISEKNGTTIGTVTRSNTDIDAAIVVTLSSTDVSEATVPATVTILAGQASATFPINAVDDTLLDGSQFVQIRASRVGYVDGVVSFVVTDAEDLTVNIDVTSITEAGGITLGRVVRSNTDVATSVVVSLLSSDTSEAVVPAIVVIPANQNQANFLIQGIDDTLLDGTQTVTITAALAGYTSGSKTLEVLDAESLTLTTSASSTSENGGALTGTVTRSNTDIDSPVTITLVSSDTTEASVPATVVIPAGQPSASFPITAVDDALLDGTQRVTITTAATGYLSGARAIDVLDSETVSLAIQPGTIQENGGSASGTVTRSNTDTAAAITVTLTSSDTTEAVVPATVTIAAGQSSATFTISAVDDNLLDGAQTVQISAAASGYAGGSQSLTVLDFEQLQLAINSTAISEQGGIATGTITRSNTDIGLPLTVQLASSDTSEATVPATVTILANQATATFTISAVDDSFLDGAQPVQISVAANGYSGSSQSLTVLDFEQLQLAINPTSISENGGSATGTVTRSNTDIDLPLTVQLTSDDASEATVPTTVTILANQSSVTFAISAVDDALLDGTQTVVISASASGYSGGTRSINVDDAETLTVSMNATSISENGGSATGTVTRSNTTLQRPLPLR